MEFQWLWISFVTLLTCYIFVNKVVRNLNDWYYDFKLRKKQYSLPPGDMGWPIIGNIWQYYKYFSSGQPDTFIDNIMHKYGQDGIYKTHLYGCPSIIVTKPEMCKNVLIDDVNFKHGYPKVTLELTRSRYLADESKRYKRLVMAPMFGHNTLEMYLERIEDIVIDKLEELSSMKEPFEFLNESRKITFKVIVHVFMGSCKPTIFKEFGDLFSDVGAGVFSVMPINLPGFSYYKALKARLKLVKVIQSIIDERRTMIKNGQIEEKKDFLDLLLEMNDNIDLKNLVDGDISDFFIAILLGGHESTASTLMWSIIFLLQNPLCLKKATEEQEEIVKARPSSQKRLSINEIKSMVYLPKVLDETLRHINNAFSTFREATTDMDINGYLIPKGWKVLAWLRAMHMDPNNHSNPKEFNPSRWDGFDPTIGTFLPFGIGRRVCPGSDLARFEITIFLHYYLLNYRLERINPECPINMMSPPKPIDNCVAKVIKLSRS